MNFTGLWPEVRSVFLRAAATVSLLLEGWIRRAFPGALICVLSGCPIIGSVAGTNAPARPPVAQEFYFTHLTVADGLSDSSMTGVVQDRQGFMWFGTAFGGLNRYDGYEFKVYQNDVRDPNSLSQNKVTTLFLDHEGVLWVGTDGGGLNRYDRGADHFTRFRPAPQNETSLPHGTVLAICDDTSGGLWVGTDDGLCRLDRATGRFVTYRNDPKNPRSLSENHIRGLFFDRDNGQLWVGTKTAGVCVFDDKTKEFVRFQSDPAMPGSLSGNKGLAFFKDRSGTFWIGTDAGLNRFVPETKSFVHYRCNPKDTNTVSGDYVWFIYEDRQRRFWVGTSTGVNLMDRERGTFTRLPYGTDRPGLMMGPIVSRICEDSTGAIWLTDTEQGVNRLAGEPRRFRVYRNNPARPESLSHNFVLGIHVETNDRVWIGTMGGLNYLDHGRPPMHRVRFPENIVPMVHTVAEDGQGGHWAGAFPEGMFHIRGNEADPMPADPSDPARPASNQIWAFEPDARGGVWILYWMVGVDYFDGRSFVRYPPDPKNPERLHEGILSDCATDQNGMIWLAGPGGLTRLDPTNAAFTTYQIDPDHPGNDINHSIVCVYADRGSPGEIWVGTSSGLFQFDPTSCRFTRHYMRADGLCSDGVQCIERDTMGNLWLGTLDGLSRFDPLRERFRNFDTADGLPGKKFFDGAAARTSDGRMFFGTTDGLVAFDPAAMTDNPHEPPVVLTDFELFNKSAEIGDENSPLKKAINVEDEITLASRQSVFTFKFAALNFSAPQKNLYAYKMEGFDDDWRYTDASRRFATYTRLAPGHYTFRVKASNNDGVWNETGASIGITITPPWWGTWWFYSLLGGWTLAMAFAVYRLRIRSIERHNRRLELEVEQRTSELQSKSDELRRSQRELLHIVDDLNRKGIALESANKELEAFSYSVSHDLRGPLRSIDGFSQALLEDYADKLDADGKEDLHAVRAATQRMGHLIDDLLRLSKLNRSEMHWSEVNLSRMTMEIAIELKRSEPHRAAEFVVAPDCVVSGDASLLKIAMENILGNAWKYTSKKAVAKIELGAMAENGARVFFVRDNGCGFDMRYAHKLFEAFHRLHTGDEFPGTGIGLASVRRVILRHGGRVWIEGAVGRGTTLYFSLPPLSLQRVATMPDFR